jgi:hypothetical protein
MKNVILFLIFSLITFGTVNAQSKKKVVKMPAFTVDNFEKKAEKFVNKEVYITGTCDHVCKHAGKKLQLVGDKGTSIEILAGKIDKFPKELEGEDLKVKAVVMEEKIDEEYLKEWESYLKKSGTACETVMGQIKDARAKMKKNKKGYVSTYYLQAVSYEKF